MQIRCSSGHLQGGFKGPERSKGGPRVVSLESLYFPSTLASFYIGQRSPFHTASKSRGRGPNITQEEEQYNTYYIIMISVIHCMYYVINVFGLSIWNAMFMFFVLLRRRYRLLCWATSSSCGGHPLSFAILQTIFIWYKSHFDPILESSGLLSITGYPDHDPEA